MSTLEIFAGKGGVGKTTCATALAVYYTPMKKAAIIDFDGGHSVYRALGREPSLVSNTFTPAGPGLSVAVVEPEEFQSIDCVKASGGTVHTYLEQFRGDMGLIPLNDMCHSFFGLCTDLVTVQKIIQLMWLLERAKRKEIEHVIVDVEPTAGLERLLSGITAITRSLRNLSETGKVKLLAIGAAWPDIKTYLAGEYIAEADEYAARLESLNETLKNARYHLVSTGEVSPAEQTFDVRKIIERSGGTVAMCVLNNLRGEPNEKRAQEILAKHALPIVPIERNLAFHLSSVEMGSAVDKIKQLRSIGTAIATGWR